MNQKELTKTLIKASEEYYNGKDSGMSDLEFDRKVNELRQMEDKSGIVYPGSPTVNVGAKVVSELKKVTHESPALSLDKVKYADKEKLTDWLKNSNGHDSAVISWKLDGLTCVLTYNGGKLVQAATRGNGAEGSDITHNAKFFKGIPAAISSTEHIVVRGEALMTFSEFERVNAEMDGVYENPRNLASATIQMLDAGESRKRQICFKAFELVTPEPVEDYRYDYDGGNRYNLCYQQDRFAFLEYLGFDVVQHDTCDSMDVLEKIEEFKADLQNLKYPTDGLVITFNNMVYGMSLGNTGHHFRHSLAMKWSDETKTTTIRDIEWSVGKTGIITPVAIFNPVRLGLGSTVTRASLHNISIMRSMTAEGSSFEKEPIRIGSEAKVYLANQIIPQILSIRNTWDNGLTCPTKYVEIPDRCPVCGGKTEIVENNGIATLHCMNHENCPAQQIGKLMNTFSKDGLFVKGLGESQISDLLNAGIVDNTAWSFYDIARRWKEFCANPYKNTSELGYQVIQELMNKDGWGKKKWENLINAIEASRNTTLQKFLYSLNIPLLGNDLSKKLSKFWHDDINHFRTWMAFVKEEGRDKAFLELTAIDGIGNEKAENLVKWAEDITAHREKYEELLDLIDELYFPETSDSASDNSLTGLTFVITGAVHEYKNRDEFKASVEARSGKVSGSVSSKTNFLVNNDVKSTSGKNKKAKELGIEIISEDEFIKRFGK